MHYFWNLHKVCQPLQSLSRRRGACLKARECGYIHEYSTLGCLSNDAKFCIVFDVVPCIIAPYLAVPDKDKQQDSQSIAI